MVEVWKVRITKDPTNKIIGITPIGIIDRNELKKIEDPKWSNPENEVELIGRTGGGVVPIIKVNGEHTLASVWRDPGARVFPVSGDILAGIGDLTVLDKEKRPRFPSLPLTITHIAEMDELIVQLNKGEFLTPVPKNIPNEFKTLYTTKAHTSINVVYPYYPRTIHEAENSQIGKFKQSWTIEEVINDNPITKMVIDGAIITFEPPEKSIEMIFPVEISIDSGYGLLDLGTTPVKIKPGGEYVIYEEENRRNRIGFYDGECIGESDCHDRGFDLRKVKPLNRFVVLLYLNNSSTPRVTVYQNGDIVNFQQGTENIKLEDIPFQDFTTLQLFKSPEKPPFSIREAIQQGITPGYTSKVGELARQAKLQNPIVFEKEEVSLRMVEEMVKILDEIRKEKDTKEFAKLARDTNRVKN
jgi:hypothetical protein